MSLSTKQIDFLNRPFDRTLDVAEGTPRSGKTTACILRFYDFLNTSKDSNFLVVGASQQQAFRLVMDGDGNGLIHLFGRQANLKHDDHGDHLEALTCSGVKKIYYKGGAKAGQRQGYTWTLPGWSVLLRNRYSPHEHDTGVFPKDICRAYPMAPG